MIPRRRKGEYCNRTGGLVTKLSAQTQTAKALSTSWTTQRPLFRRSFRHYLLSCFFFQIHMGCSGVFDLKRPCADDWILGVFLFSLQNVHVEFNTELDVKSWNIWCSRTQNERVKWCTVQALPF